jgi:hypothetical protein
MKLVLASFLLMASQAFALDLSLDCAQYISSDKVRAAAEKGLDRIDRMETTYTMGIKTTSRTGASFCPSESSKDVVTVGAAVTADTWGEEGSLGEQISECFVRIERQDKDWVPVYLTCEDFGIDEDL